MGQKIIFENTNEKSFQIQPVINNFILKSDNDLNTKEMITMITLDLLFPKFPKCFTL